MLSISFVICLPYLLIFVLFSVDSRVAAQEGPGIVIVSPAGQDVELLCTVNETSDNHVTEWLINLEGPYGLNALFNGERSGHSSNHRNIIVQNITMNDVRNGNEYMCVILLQGTTIELVHSKRTFLYVAGVPAKVPDITVNENIAINRSNVTLTLNWGEPFNNLDRIANYTVSCSGDVTCPPNFTTTDNTTRSYTITNLTPMTNYTFSVVATNSIGSGEAGVLNVTTPPDVPTMVPGVTVVENSINRNIVTLTLNWEEPFNNLDPIVNYTVSCSGDVTCPPNFTTTDNTTRSYTITNLTPMTNYTFSVVATNSIGSGEAAVVMINTPPGTVDVPRIVPDITIDSNTISVNRTNVTLTLSWGEPFNNFDPIVNYTVSCSGDVTCPPNFTTTDNTTRSYTITNLTTMTTYTFSVVATNSNGSGEAGVVMITTPPVTAGVPAIVPNATVDDNSININGTNVTLTLSWGEPFNNFDPIMNYTVSCSGDILCPQNFITTDNTTRSYTITNLTTMTNYTFSVVATNSIGIGEAAEVNITTPGIDQVTGVMVTCELVGLINQCTAMWNPITQGDVTGYLVHYNGTMMNVTSSTTTLTFTAPSLPDGVFTGTIVVMVMAIGRHGIGPASEPETAVFTVGSSVITAIPRYMYTSVTSELYNITVVCTIHPDSTADQCEVMAVADGRVTKTDIGSISNDRATVVISDLQCGIEYTIMAEGMLNGAIVGPGSSHGNVTAGPCPTTGGSKSEDDFWIIIVAVVGGGMLVINVLTVITISLYCKHRYSVNKDYKLSDNHMNSQTKTNSTHCSLLTKDAPEKRKEVINATYIPSSGAVMLGGDKALNDVYDSIDTDYVTVKNTTGNSADNNTTNVTGADVQMKSNPSYDMHSDRTQIESAVYVATTEDNTKPVYNYANTSATDVTADNGLTGNIELNDIPTYGSVATITMNTNNTTTK